MLTVCYLTLLIEFVTGAPVQHHIHQHPERHAEGEELDHLYWNATFEVGDEAPYAVVIDEKFTKTSL